LRGRKEKELDIKLKKIGIATGLVILIDKILDLIIKLLELAGI